MMNHVGIIDYGMGNLTSVRNAFAAIGAQVRVLTAPSELADDHAPTGAVILHALKSLEERGEVYDVVGCLYATAVLVNPARLAEGHALVQSGQAVSCMSVARYAFPVWRAMTVTGEGFLAPIWPEYRASRSQDLPEAWHDAGQFYWVDVKKYLAEGRIISQDACPVELPAWRVQDIDTEEDWIRAELMFKSAAS
jgi:pseudaminic acid cytidylyltransferase